MSIIKAYNFYSRVITELYFYMLSVFNAFLHAYSIFKKKQFLFS